ncbi:MAG: hypothetical protein OXT74_15445, partial [Candidatus Poribacteria bacterium]|nr:hypothetical protein [Candidatus Poribacteria bacterium]
MLLTVIGGIVGAVLTMATGSFSPLGAQSQSDSFREIICTGLTVVDAAGETQVRLSAFNGGGVEVYNERGGLVIKMGSSELEGSSLQGGVVRVLGKGWREAAMFAGKHGGVVQILG